MIVECEKLNSSFCKVMCEEYDIILDINAWFSVFTDGYQFSPSYKMHLWDGKTKFFNLKNQILPIGLKGSLKKFCEKNGYEYKESGFENYEEFNSDEFKSLTDKFVTKLTMREYQAQATEIALNKRIGILAALVFPYSIMLAGSLSTSTPIFLAILSKIRILAWCKNK